MKPSTILTLISLTLLNSSNACITGGGDLLGNACDGLTASAVLTDNGVQVCNGEDEGPHWAPYNIPCIAGYSMTILDALAERIAYVTPHGNFEFEPNMWTTSGPYTECLGCPDPVCTAEDWEFDFSEYGC